MKIDFFSNNFLTKLSDNIIDKKNNNYPKISIVMPSYNQVQFIERSILSILNQDYPNTELIIVDGGSKDGTVDVIQKYKDAITLWISEKDQGQSDALNKGFKHCTGEIYGWLNSDDIYLPNAFKVAIEALEKNVDKKIVFGDWLSLNKVDKVFDYNHAFDFNLNHFKYESFHLSAQSMFWRADVYKRFLGFDNRLYNTMDYQMILEFGINEGNNSFLRIPHILGGFRVYDGQKTVSGMNIKVINEHKLIAQKYNYEDKYELIGTIKRLYFRIRRTFWYMKRGGIMNLINRLKKSYVNRI